MVHQDAMNTIKATQEITLYDETRTIERILQGENVTTILASDRKTISKACKVH